MKVKELIEKLQQYPENMEVFTYGTSCTGNILKYLADDVCVKEEKFIQINKGFFIIQRPCKETAGAKKCLVV
jgi:hypothetical protein